MRRSPERTPLAKLRVFLGLPQREMARICDCSIPLIQTYELDKKRLSESLAMRVALETGVSVQWLLKNDVQAKMVDGHGRIYTEETFKTQQANAASPGVHSGEKLHVLRCYAVSLQKLSAIFLNAYSGGKFNLASYQVAKELDAICKKFGVSPEKIESDLDSQPRQTWLGREGTTIAEVSVRDFGLEFSKRFKEAAEKAGFMFTGEGGEAELVYLKSTLLVKRTKQGKKK